MAQEYYSLEEVLKQLQIEREELDEIVADGEIQVRENGNEVFYFKEDVEEIRRNKMEELTMRVPSNSDDDMPMEIQELEDIRPELNDEESDDSIALGKRFTHTQPLLQIHDTAEEQIAEPVLGIGSDSDSDNIKSDTEELIFEQSNDEDLLETGELLFDSVDQKILPQDRAEAALFTESEMGISSEFDDIDESKVKEAIDFMDSGEEEIVSSSDSRNGSYKPSSPKKKTFAGVLVGIIVVIIIGVAIYLPSSSDIDKEKKWTKITVHKTNEVSLDTKHSISSKTKALGKQILRAQFSGTITGLLPEKSKVKKGETIASIGGSKEIMQKLQTQKAALAKLQKPEQEYQDLLARFKEYRSKNKKEILEAKKEYSRIRRTRGDKKTYKKLWAQFRKSKHFKFMGKFVGYTKKLRILKRKRPKKAEIEKLQKEIASLEKSANEKVAITSLVNGVIVKWNVVENQQVENSAGLCVIEEIDTLKCSFHLEKSKILSKWQEQGVKIFLTLGDKEVSSTVESVHEDKGVKPVTVYLNLNIENKDLTLVPEMEAQLNYTTSTKALAIPEAVVKNNEKGPYVLAVTRKGEKIVVSEKAVQLGEKNEKGYYPIVGGLTKGEEIVESIVSGKLPEELSKQGHEVKEDGEK